MSIVGGLFTGLGVAAGISWWLYVSLKDVPSKGFADFGIFVGRVILLFLLGIIFGPVVGYTISEVIIQDANQARPPGKDHSKTEQWQLKPGSKAGKWFLLLLRWFLVAFVVAIGIFFLWAFLFSGPPMTSIPG